MAKRAAHDEYVDEALKWVRPEGPIKDAALPVLDFGPWLRGDAGAAELLAAQLRGALTTHGFYVMVNSGVDPEPVLEAGRRFHALPLEVKERCGAGRHRLRVGYLPVGSKYQITSRREKKNMMSTWSMMVRGRVGVDDNNWPAAEDAPGFRGAMERHVAALRALCRRTLPLYAAALRTPAQELVRLFDVPFENTSVHHYDPCAPERGVYGVNPHCDNTFMTVLAMDGPGLVVSTWRGDGEGGAGDASAEWGRVTPIRGAYVVNTGDIAKRLSNDIFLATRHYADSPPPGAPPRVSVPFFFNPSGRARLACLSGTVTGDRPARYRAVSLAEYFGGTARGSDAPPPKL